MLKQISKRSIVDEAAALLTVEKGPAGWHVVDRTLPESSRSQPMPRDAALRECRHQRLVYVAGLAYSVKVPAADVAHDVAFAGGKWQDWRHAAAKLWAFAIVANLAHTGRCYG